LVRKKPGARALGRHIHRQPLGEVAHTSFGGAVSHDARQRAKRAHGGNVEDHTLVVLGHLVSEYLGRQQCAQQIEVERPSEGLHRQVKERALRAGGRVLTVAPCAVDENVCRSPQAGDLRRGGFQGVALQDIRVESHGAFPDVLCAGVRAVFTAIQQRHPCSLLGEETGDGRTQDTASPRDDSHFSIQPKRIHSQLLVVGLANGLK
jgi:hypothetical protein